MTSRLITVAIHTYEHAVALRTILENEGIEVVFNNVNLDHPEISSGIRVRIKESDLPLALRIIENRDIFLSSDNKTGSAHTILAPVDFSDYSMRATRVAFKLAKTHKAEIVLLHTFIDPYIAGSMQLTDSLTYEIADNASRKAVEAAARTQMDHFTARLRKMMKSGELPAVKFTTKIMEGVPEDVIVEYAKENTPYLVVMGTRGAGKKEKEMIGSVTAEVLDKSRLSVLAIPERQDADENYQIRNVFFFSNLDQEDILAMDSLYRFFPRTKANITIVHVPGKKRPFERDPKDNLERLKAYCSNNFPRFTFTSATLSLETIIEDYNRLERKFDIDLLVVPNKKKNVFSRLFNPSLAHKILFSADIPMLVIPV